VQLHQHLGLHVQPGAGLIERRQVARIEAIIIIVVVDHRSTLSCGWARVMRSRRRRAPSQARACS
jgi:hypothetical protein